MPSSSQHNVATHEDQQEEQVTVPAMQATTVNGHSENGVHDASAVSFSDLNISSDTLDTGDDLYSQDLPGASPHLPSYRISPIPGTASKTQSNESLPIIPNQKSYDYLLKVLLVGDSDVGKQEILSGLEDGTLDSPFCSSSGAAYKTTTILIDGKRVKLQLWDTSGQGRFCTIIRSYSRGAQGILLVYDITNKWSFEGIDRWLKEVDQVNEAN